MPHVRPPKDGPEELTVTPAGKPPFVATRGEWVDVEDADVAKGLVAQGWESSEDDDQDDDEPGPSEAHEYVGGEDRRCEVCGKSNRAAVHKSEKE